VLDLLFNQGIIVQFPEAEIKRILDEVVKQIQQ
jgi:hypothetical protein